MVLEQRRAMMSFLSPRENCETGGFRSNFQTHRGPTSRTGEVDETHGAQRRHLFPREKNSRKLGVSKMKSGDGKEPGLEDPKTDALKSGDVEWWVRSLMRSFLTGGSGGWRRGFSGWLCGKDERVRERRGQRRIDQISILRSGRR